MLMIGLGGPECGLEAVNTRILYVGALDPS